MLGRVARGRLASAELDAASARLADPRDRALLHELVLGSLRRRGWLDHVLAGLSSRPLASLDAAVRDTLRLAAYQLLQHRTPAHAVVSDAVELARAAEPRAAGFVNAILRRLQREGPPPAPDPVADPAGWLATEGSLPAWLAERWLARLGPEAAVARARAALEAPPAFVRLNPRFAEAREEVEAAGIELAPTRVPGALRATGAGLAALADRGLVYVQDAGSQLVARLAASEGLVLDACAAPGGKAMLLADLQTGASRVVAGEPAHARLSLMRRLVRRWGGGRVVLVAADALQPPFRPGSFDAVLLDAPCSGLGTLGRHPEIRWRLTPAEIERHAERQRALLASLTRLVRPGGRLVYATCSLEPEETHAVVDAFLAGEPGFAEAELPEWARCFGSGRRSGSGRVELDPAEREGDGFFAAMLARRAPAPAALPS